MRLRSFILFLLPSLVALALAIVLMLHSALQPAPFAFGSEVAIPDKSAVCPGDTLRWQSRTIVSHAPVVATRYQTIWSVADQRTVVPELAPRSAIWRVPVAITQTISLLVPQLPAGIYEVRIAGQVEGSEVAVYFVPFAIRKDCH